MIVPTVLAAIAALPLAVAQSANFRALSDVSAYTGLYYLQSGYNHTVPTAAVSGTSYATTQTLHLVTSQVTARAVSTATRCTTSYGFNSTSQVDTWYSFPPPITSTTRVISTTRETITVTPEATTFTNVVTTTVEVVTTMTTTPSAVVVPTPAGFAPILLVNIAQPTANSRIKRFELESRSEDLSLDLFKRQTAPGNVGGYIAYRNGSYSNLYRRYPHRVDCRVGVVVDETITSIVEDTPETQTIPQETAIALSTIIVATTTTVVEVAPRPTDYAACRANNVVKNITDLDGNIMVFDRVIFRPDEGYPIANELVVDIKTDVKCCVACQNTPHCAGSFFAPGNEEDGVPPECHIRLTERYTPAALLPSASASAFLGFSGNGSQPTFPAATGTGAVVPISSDTPDNGTCSKGSRSYYLGVIRGQNDFPEKYALSFSNGPCGRYSVSPIPVAGVMIKREIAAY